MKNDKKKRDVQKRLFITATDKSNDTLVRVVASQRLFESLLKDITL